VTATPEQRKAYIRAISLGMTRTIAAKAAGVHRGTPYDWIEKDPEFEAEVERARGQFLERHFGVVTKAAAEGEWRASVWLLSISEPECGKQRVELTGKDGGPVQVDARAAVIDAARELADAALGLAEAPSDERDG